MALLNVIEMFLNAIIQTNTVYYIGISILNIQLIYVMIMELSRNVIISLLNFNPVDSDYVRFYILFKYSIVKIISIQLYVSQYVLQRFKTNGNIIQQII